MAEPKALESSLNKLSLESKAIGSSPSLSSSKYNNNNNNNNKKKQQDISESWEDEELEDSDEDAVRPLSPQQSADYPSAPPPTPISPPPSFTRENFINPYGYGAGGGTSDGGVERASARPEKTDAVAKRMIAGALGVRAPKKTDEQRAYDRAIKEKEIKRKNLEKEAMMRAKEEAERQKAAVWDD